MFTGTRVPALPTTFFIVEVRFPLLVLYLIFEVRMRILTYRFATLDIHRQRLQPIVYSANALVFALIHSPHESGHVVSSHVRMVLLYPIFVSRVQLTGECFVALLLALEVWNEP
jgi:hypothetical protein